MRWLAGSGGMGVVGRAGDAGGMQVGAGWGVGWRPWRAESAGVIGVGIADRIGGWAYKTVGVKDTLRTG